MRDLGGASLVGHLWLDLQHLKEPVEAGAAFLIKPREIHEPVYWVDEHRNAHQEGEQVGEGERRARDACRAEDDHRNRDELGEGGHPAGEPCLAAIADASAVEEAIVLVVKARGLEGLVGEGLNHPYPGE